MSRSLSRALRPLLASTSRSITANHRSAISFAYSSSSSVIAAPSPSSSPLSRLSRRTYATSPTPPTGLDEGERLIYEKLKARFGGKQLEVQDVSGGCGSFYAILVSSPAFKGLSTIKQHKLVNECLKEDIKTIHGLQLKTIPEE